MFHWSKKKKKGRSYDKNPTENPARPNRPSQDLKKHWVKPMRGRAEELVGIFRQSHSDYGFIDPIVPTTLTPLPLGGSEVEETDIVITDNEVIETVASSGEHNGVFVHASKSLDALDGDTVCYRIMMGRFGKTEGRITHIRSRSSQPHFGKLSRKGNTAMVSLFDRAIQVRIQPRSLEKWGKEIREGITVGVQVFSYGKSMDALILQILGFEGESGYYRSLLLAQSGVPQEFSAAVIAEAKSIPAPAENPAILERYLTQREDRRTHTILTIDGADAKDLDDAIEVEKTDDGYVLGVHIADVAEYVRIGTELDREAAKRGTSIYLVDSVIPMLPPRLSNELCSLHPGSPKLTLSIDIELDMNGKVRKTRIYESIIDSKYRATYEEIQADRDGRKTEVPEPIRQTMRHAWELKEILDRRRKGEGKIDFPSHEAKFILENGKLVEIQKYPHYDSNDLIEQFMVIANEEVSRWASEKKLPIPYRIHAKPSLLGIGRLRDMLNGFGVSLNIKNEEKPTSREIQRAVEQLRIKDPEGFTVKWAISTMSKALYTTKNIGHFGLALEYYSHFTSPIRRYPDLLLHRNIKEVLHKKSPWVGILAMELLCKDSSTKERRAEKLEYDYRDTLVCEWLSDKIGRTYAGRITSVMDKWYFVEFLPFVEGFLPKWSSSRGENSQESKGNYSQDLPIGETVPVVLVSANVRTRRIELKKT